VTVRVEIAILFDDYPEEVGIVVTDDACEFNVVNYPPGSFSSPGDLFRETVDLIPGDYKIIITDSFGDGICCEWGEGRFEVHALFPDNEMVLLAEGEGRFTDSIVVAFTVPSPPETEPPGPSTAGCQDQEDATFLVDSEVGDADCAWLGDNLVRYNYLCQFLDVAATCRQTCDACEYFE
jgi:hypothetical protein